MKTFIKKHPILVRYLLAIILFSIALISSGFINKGIIKEYFPYTSVILLIIATWILLKMDSKTIQYLGLNLSARNIRFLPLGIAIGALAFLAAKYLRSYYLGEVFNIADEFNYKNMLYGLYIILPTVAVEESLFRGYLFKKTIDISSVAKANIILAIIFTMVHVFDRGVLEKPPMIIFLIVTIPIGHLLFATAFHKSKSLFFAIGIHLGNNWATQHLITTTNDGNSFLYISNNGTFETWPSFLLFLLIWNSFFLLVTFIIWKWDSNFLKIQFMKILKTS